MERKQKRRNTKKTRAFSACSSLQKMCSSKRICAAETAKFSAVKISANFFSNAAVSSVRPKEREAGCAGVHISDGYRGGGGGGGGRPSLAQLFSQKPPFSM